MSCLSLASLSMATASAVLVSANFASTSNCCETISSISASSSDIFDDDAEHVLQGEPEQHKTKVIFFQNSCFSVALFSQKLRNRQLGISVTLRFFSKKLGIFNDFTRGRSPRVKVSADSPSKNFSCLSVSLSVC